MGSGDAVFEAVEPDETRFAIAVEREAQRVVRVTLGGSLDLATVQRVEKELAHSLDGTSTVFLDMSAVEFMDSCGLRLLLELRERSIDCGFTLAVTGARGSRDV